MKFDKKKFDAATEHAFRWFNFVILVVYCITLIIPLVWMTYTSFKTHHEYVISTFALPKVWTFGNYAEAFEKLKLTVTVPKGTLLIGIDTMAFNSIAMSGFTSLLNIAVTACVAYVVGRYEFIGKNFIYNLGIVVMILPIIGSLPSAMMVRKTLGVYDNLFLYIITSPSCIFGLNFLMLYGMFKSSPKAYSEAAEIDGAGHFQIFFRIYLPMMLPTCVVLFVLQFLNSWNDYMTPMIWLPSYPNLAYGMYFFDRNAASMEADPPTILAGFAIIMIPTAILYVSCQKLIVQKFTVGGLKG